MARCKGFKTKTITGQGGCFSGTTLISMADGSTKPIKDIEVGEHVMAWEMPNGLLQPREVTHTHKHNVLFDTVDDRWMLIQHEQGTLICTDNHHILTEQGTWQEAIDFVEDDDLLLADGSHSRITYIAHENSEDDAFMDDFDFEFSYNLTVDIDHTYIADGVRVSNGGGGKDEGDQHVPQEAQNTLQSKQLVRVLDLLGEGEIEGLAYPPGFPNAGDTITDTTHLGQGIFIDNASLADADNNINYGGVNINLKTGDPYPLQTVVPGFKSTENVVGVGVDIEKASPISRESIPYEVDGVRVILTWNGISDLNAENGDLNGTTVTLAIDSRKNGTGDWNQRNKDVVEGKTTSAYQRQYRINKPSGVGPGDTWGIQVRRLSEDSEVARIQDAFQWSAYVEIVDTKFSYPDTALVGVNLDSQLLGNRIPIRSYEVKGLKIKIPSNYDPNTRDYTGLWDGTFTVAWSNNPAWVLYDILINARYGLGTNISESQIDKFKFYEVAQYCDGIDASGNFVGVSDGLGGTEPRYTFNGIIGTQEEALKVINAISTAFMGMSYWSSGAITVSQDAPADPIRLIGPANTIDGLFNYSTTALNARHSRAKVSFNDPNDAYRPRIEFVDDAESIIQFGVQERSIAAIGCTSRGQADRFGRWMLDSEKYEGMSVTFSTSFEQADLFPGAIIDISDPNFSGYDFFGKCEAGSTTTNVKLDRSITLDSPGPYTLAFMRIDSYSDTSSASEWGANTNTFTYTNTPDDLTDKLRVGEEIEITGFNDMGTLTGSLEAVNATSRFVFTTDDPTDYYVVGDVIEVFDMTAANNGLHVITDIGATFIEVLASSLVDEGPNAAIQGPIQNGVNGFFRINAVTATTFDVAATLPASNPTSFSPVTLNGELGIIEAAQDISGVFPQTADNFTVSTAFTVAPSANCVWMIQGDAAGQAPTKWRVISNVEEDKNIFAITAIRHDPLKYQRIEDGIVIEPDEVTRFDERAIAPVCKTVNDTVEADASTSPFNRFVFDSVNPLTAGFEVGDMIDVAGFDVNLDDNTGIFEVIDVDATSIQVASVLVDEGPTGNVWIRQRLSVTLEAQTDGLGVRPRMRVAFNPPTEGELNDYRMEYTFNAGPVRTVDFNGTPQTFIENPQSGTYVLSVTAINILGFKSIPCETIVTYSSGDLFSVDSIAGLKIDGVVVTTDPQEWFGTSPVLSWNRLSQMGNFTGDIITELTDTEIAVDAVLEKYVRLDGGDWAAEGYEAGDLVSCSGFVEAENNGNFEVLSVTTSDLFVDHNLVAETTTQTATFQQIQGVESGQFDGFFRDYRVRFENPDTDETILTTYTREPQLQLSLPLNTSMYGGIPQRDFRIFISARDRLERESTVVEGNFTNPTPAVPTNVLFATLSDSSYDLVYDECAEEDCFGYVLVCHSKVSGFTPSLVRETKSTGLVTLLSGIATNIVQVSVDGLIISGNYEYTDSNLTTQAEGVAASIRATETTPNYTAQRSGAAGILITAVNQFGSTPDGLAVTTVTTGAATTSELDFAGGVDAVLVGEGIAPAGIIINSNVEKDQTYYVRVAFVDTFWNGSHGVVGLNFSDEIVTTATVDASADFGSAPAQVTGVGAIVNSIIQLDGTSQKDIVVSWLSVAGAKWYTVEITEGGVTDEYNVGSSATEYTLKAATQDSLHSIRVLAANNAGDGPYSSPAVTVTPSGDVTAPGLPTNIAVVSSFKGAFISAEPPLDLDMSRIEVWFAVTNDRDTSIRAGSMVANPELVPDGQLTFYHSYGDDVGPVTRYYWVRSVDNSGNPSALTPSRFAGHQAISVTVETDDIFDEAVTFEKIADFAVDNAKITNLAVTEAKIGALAVTNAKIGDLAVDNAKIGLLAVQEANIAALSVTNAKIGSLAVDTLQINGLAVETDKIGNNAVNDISFAFTSSGTAIGNGPSWTTVQATGLGGAEGEDALLQAYFGLTVAFNFNGANVYTIDGQMRLRNTTDSIDVFTVAATPVFQLSQSTTFTTGWVIGTIWFNTTGMVTLTAGKNYTLYLEARKSVTGAGAGSWATANATLRFLSMQEIKK